MDPDTFVILWTRIYSNLLSRAYFVGARSCDVDDLLQNVAIKLMKARWKIVSADPDQMEDAFRAYAWFVLRCLWRAEWRRRRQAAQPPEDGADVPGAGIEQLLARLEYEEALAFALNPSRPCYRGPRGEIGLSYDKQLMELWRCGHTIREAGRVLQSEFAHVPWLADRDETLACRRMGKIQTRMEAWRGRNHG